MKEIYQLNWKNKTKNLIGKKILFVFLWWDGSHAQKKTFFFVWPCTKPRVQRVFFFVFVRQRKTAQRLKQKKKLILLVQMLMGGGMVITYNLPYHMALLFFLPNNFLDLGLPWIQVHLIYNLKSLKLIQFKFNLINYVPHN
jgi:hypothetical protein